MSQATLVIMAAGIGSRFGKGIKQLAPVGPNGEIIMDYSIYDAMEAGFDKVVFVIRKDLEEEFKKVIGNRIEKQVEVAYAYQELKDIPEHSIFVVEISSFQLEDTISLKADDGIITNVDYNHLDEVYNYDFYVASKKRMGFLVKKNHLFFYDEIKEISLPHINLSSIPMEEDDINLPFFMGEHNHRHVKMSLYIGTLYGISKEEGANALYQLMPLPFRNEKILSSFTATIINDSKSTNVASTNQCLLTFQDKKRILILGGIAKSATFDHLLLKKEDEVYAYGRDRELVIVSIERAHLFSTLEEVMLAIEPDLHKDVYILFSPACSSYDQFENYMVRGTYFRQLIKRLEP